MAKWVKFGENKSENKKNKFYIVEPVMENVSKEEFDKFLKSYPRKLVADVYGVCEPPSLSYNDFELANRWPYSIVAMTELYSDDPNSWLYAPLEERVFRVMTNYEEVYNSKTGYAEV